MHWLNDSYCYIYHADPGIKQLHIGYFMNNHIPTITSSFGMLQLFYSIMLYMQNMF